MRRLQNKIANVSQHQRSAYANTNYDLAIVGSGISCAYTSIHYLTLLENRSTAESKEFQTVKIAVLDKSEEFWTGIPYGSRSGKQSLIITPLKEFLS